MAIDEAILKIAQGAADQLRAAFSSRDADFVKYEEMYLLTWTPETTTEEDIKVTISPDPRNVIKGVVRLLATTAPKFYVEVPADAPAGIADKIENFIRAVWEESSKAYGGPIHESIVESSALYGETHVAINSTAAVVANSTPTNKAHAQLLASKTPFLIEPWNPHYGYALSDPIYGLSAYVRIVSATVGEIGSRFGVEGAAYAVGKDLTEQVDLFIYYDATNYAAWVEGTSFVAEEHKLPIIPISVVLTDGTLLFSKPEQQRQPILYGVTKSKIWERQNLLMTVLYTNIYHLGLNPTFIHTAPPNEPEKKVSYDGHQRGGVIDLAYGERFEAMQSKGLMDPSFGMALTLLDNKMTESTVYKSALGAELAGSPAYSTYALLSQSGRLPLVQIQTRTEFAIADIMTKALLWYQKVGGNASTIIKPSEIPDTFSLRVKLDVNLPQDKLQAASIATMLKDHGLVDDAWIHANILNIEDTTKMHEAVWTQQAADAMVQIYLQQKLQQALVPPGQSPLQPQLPGISTQAMQQAQALQQAPTNLGVPTPNSQVGGPGFNPRMGGLPPNAAGTLPAVTPEALPNA